MKVKHYLILIITFTLFLTAPVFTAVKLAKICYVNTQTILEFHPASRNIMAEMKQIKTRFKSELEALEREIRDLEQKIKTEGPRASQNELRSLYSTLETKKEALNDGINRRNEELTRIQKNKLQPVYQQILEDIKKYASSQGYNIVIDSRYILIGSPDLDITEALKKYFMSR